MNKLVEEMLRLIAVSGLTDKQITERFNLGMTWIGDVRSGRSRNPGIQKVQEVIEGLSGAPILKGPLEINPAGLGASNSEDNAPSPETQAPIRSN